MSWFECGQNGKIFFKNAVYSTKNLKFFKIGKNQKKLISNACRRIIYMENAFFRPKLRFLKKNQRNFVVGKSSNIAVNYNMQKNAYRRVIFPK